MYHSALPRIDYLYHIMENQYRILQALYEIVKDDLQPLQYNCSIRELLLRLKGDWQSEYLEELALEKLIIVHKAESVTLKLTEKGWEKATQVLQKSRHS